MRPYCISFHAVIVFDLGKNLFYKSVLGHSVRNLVFFETPQEQVPYWLMAAVHRVGHGGGEIFSCFSSQNGLCF